MPSGGWEIVKLAAQQAPIAVTGPGRWNRILRAPIEKSGGDFCLSHPSTNATAPLRSLPQEGWPGLKRQPWIGALQTSQKEKKIVRKRRRRKKKKTEKNRKNPRHARAERGKAYCGGMQAGYECSAQIENGSLRPCQRRKCYWAESSKLCRMRLSLVVPAWSCS